MNSKGATGVTGVTEGTEIDGMARKIGVTGVTEDTEFYGSTRNLWGTGKARGHGMTRGARKARNDTELHGIFGERGWTRNF
ncbi:hypothetical protein MYX65_10840 [Acidobacteria bacterium AH-259-L09]|nr:hypothetical protein [Acidobacteria bacterium AH-259-L09]